ncbi:MAG: hypothetical protein U0324_17620 [Polyangiales bacterium]
MAAQDDNVFSFATAPAPPAQALGSSRTASGRFSENVLGRLGALLSKALEDAASIEVRTYTSSAADSAVAANGEALTQNMRLRAFTRAAIDGDTEVCVPLRADGAVDDALWEIHREATAAARADRARAVDAAISAVQKIVQAVK